MNKYKWLQLINLQDEPKPAATPHKTPPATPPAHPVSTTHEVCSTGSQAPQADSVENHADESPTAQRREYMERAELELSLLNEISRVLGSTLDLHSVFDQTMRVLAERLGMERGSLVLRDEMTGKLHTETAVGLTPEEIQRGTYEMGEGITGSVVARGESIVVADIGADERFLNRTGARNVVQGVQTSFICVPIKTEGRTVGALSVDKRFHNDEWLKSDQRLLEIVASFIAQALKINEIVAEEREEWQEEKRSINANLRSKYKFDNIIGSAPAMLDVFDTIAQVAVSRATCLLLGETGTGKELIAKAVHFNSNRAEKPFIRVNCGALTGTLLESELFGHVRGSFTGASHDKAGLFEHAHGGTLFLDEIGELPLHLQSKLLRAVQ